MSSNVLAKIVDNKRQEVDQRKKDEPAEKFQDTLKPSTRSLKEALSSDGADFILECKKASPSKGLIRENFDLNYILSQYTEFASAISVLTDSHYFQGNFEYLTQASETVNVPILCKDFFIDSYQIFEARRYGADAILLMLSVLDDEQYLELAQVAAKLSLDILTEVHSQEELERALKLDAKIIGINNRNLKTLSIDLKTTEFLAKKITSDRIVISESGIETRRDIKRLSGLVNGFLIGSSIMAKADIRHQCKSLLYGKVKICGLTQPEDAITVDQSGGTYGGIIFYKNSPRYVDISQARKIVDSASLRYVGVFVDEAPEIIIRTAKYLDLFAIQFHGNESDELITEVRKQLPNIQIWRAIPIDDSLQLQSNPLIDRYLLDTCTKDAFGGTGKTFDWQLIREDSLVDIRPNEIILAGGIDLNNVEEAASMQTYAIDLSSGVEGSPGEKSQDKIQQLFERLRA